MGVEWNEIESIGRVFAHFIVYRVQSLSSKIGEQNLSVRNVFWLSVKFARPTGIIYFQGRGNFGEKWYYLERAPWPTYQPSAVLLWSLKGETIT